MKTQKFDDIVAARTEERMQDKIRTCKNEIKQALSKLTGSGLRWHGWPNVEKWQEQSCVDVLKVLMSSSPDNGWPKFLWDNEREKVTNEILSQLDLVQQAVISAANPVKREVFPVGEIA